jgi:AraC-like DNA-binding protein
MLESLHHTISQKVSEIFDLYTELHGIRISLFSPEGRLLYPDSVGRPNCRHCSMLRETMGMESLCRDLDRKMMQAAFEQEEMISYTCHAGMREAAAPLIVDHDLVGYVMLGQFRSQAAPATSPYAGRWMAEQGSDELQEEFVQTPVFPEEKIATLLSMFRHLLELIIGSHLIHHKDHDLLAPVMEHMREHPADQLSLEEASRMTGRSTSTVSRLFKKTTGRSFKQYQVWFRLDQASNLLVSKPNRPVAEIAQAVGFDDPLYFSRVFHKHLRLSPSDYRKQNLPPAANAVDGPART